MGLKRNIALVLISLVANFVVPSLGTAESRTICGVSFPVESLTPIDSRTFKIVLDGRARVMSDRDIDLFIVNYHLGDELRARAFTPTLLQTFIAVALSEGRVHLAEIGLLAFLGGDTLGNPAGVIDFLRDLEKFPATGRAVQATLERVEVKAIPREILVALVYQAAIGDAEWLRVKGLPLAYLYPDEMRRYLRDRFIGELHHNIRAALSPTLQVYRAIFGDTDSELAQLNQFFRRLQEALNAPESDIEPLVTLSATVSKDEALRNVVSPIILERIHQSAAGEMHKGHGGRALLILSRIDPEIRTPITHEFTRNVLSSLRPEESAVLKDSTVFHFLTILSSFDSGIRDGTIGATTKAILSLAQGGDPDGADALLRKLLSLRPDPHRENDDLRTTIAKSYLAKGMAVSAREVMSHRSAPLSIVESIKLGLSGFYGQELVLVVGGVSLLLSLIIAGRLFGLPLYRRFRPLPLPEEEGEEEEQLAGAFEVGAHRLLRPGYQEYNRCLQILGLEPGSTERTIKSRYRQLIKAVHPDLNQNLSESEQNRFISLTRTYDRLLELRKEMNLKD